MSVVVNQGIVSTVLGSKSFVSVYWGLGFGVVGLKIDDADLHRGGDTLEYDT